METLGQRWAGQRAGIGVGGKMVTGTKRVSRTVSKIKEESDGMAASVAVNSLCCGDRTSLVSGHADGEIRVGPRWYRATRTGRFG